MARPRGAESRFPNQQYNSSDFVESCGAILFDLSDPSTTRVCLGNLVKQNEWILPKGRRNINESRKDAALREVYEETGYRCRLLPVTMATRATAEDDPADIRDKPRVREGVTEPFMCTTRQLKHGVKIIWWFIAVLDDARQERGPGEKDIKPEFFQSDEAIDKLHFETDRQIVEEALKIVKITVDKEQK